MKLEEKRISTQSKLIELLKELGDSSDNDIVELKKLAQEKADAIVSEAIEIEDSIDVPAQVVGIAQYLMDNGFELED